MGLRRRMNALDARSGDGRSEGSRQGPSLWASCMADARGGRETTLVSIDAAPMSSQMPLEGIAPLVDD